MRGVRRVYVCDELRPRYGVDGLEELLLADGGDEFLEVEGFEVGNVFEAGGAVGFEGGGEHGGGVGAALEEAGVGVGDDVGAFAGAVSDEEGGAVGELGGEGGFVNYNRGGFRNLLAFRGEDGGVDFHAAGIHHWNNVMEIADKIPGQARNRAF